MPRYPSRVRRHYRPKPTRLLPQGQSAPVPVTLTDVGGAAEVAAAPSIPLAYSDNFTRANSSTLGSNWTDWNNSLLGLGGLEISSNTAVENGTPGGSAWWGAAWTGAAIGSDQFSAATIATVPGSGDWIGAFVRATNSDNTQGYLTILFNGSVYLFAMNGTTTPPQLGSSVSVGTTQAGDTLAVQAHGSTITVLYNGATLITQTDTTWTSGAPGIALINGGSNPAYGGWQGGGYGAPWVVQTAEAGSGGGSWAAALSAATVAGDTLVYSVSAYENTGAVPASSAPTLGGSSVSGATKAASVVDTNSIRLLTDIWVLPNVPAGQTACAVTVANAQSINNTGLIVCAVRNLGTSPVIDQVTTGNSASTPSTAVSSGTTGATASGSEVIVGAAAIDQNTSPTAAGFTGQATGGDTNSWAGYQLAQAAGGTYSWQQTASAAANWSAAVVTIAPTSSGGGSAFAVTAAVPVADIAAEVDDATGITAAAAVPLADTAGEAETLATGSPVSLADTAGAADALAVSAGVPLADVAGETDADAVTAQVPVSDTAGQTDALTAAVAAPLADVAAQTDSSVVSASVALADTAGQADAVTVAQGGNPVYTDDGGALDALTAAVAVSLPYAQIGSNNPYFATNTNGWSGFNGTLTQSSSPPAGCPFGTAAEYVNNGVTAGAAENSSTGGPTPAQYGLFYAISTLVFSSQTTVQIGFDWRNGAGSYLASSTANITVPVNTWVWVTATFQCNQVAAATGYARVGLPTASGGTVWMTAVFTYGGAEVAAALDAVAVSAAAPLADTAAAADALAVSVTAPLADVAAETDLPSEAATIAVGDTAGADDVLAVHVSAGLSDTGAAADAGSFTATVTLTDTAAQADTWNVVTGVQIALTDVAGAADSWYVLTSQDLSYWYAHAEKPRWRARPGVPRWEAMAAEPRWLADVEAPRWQAQPAGPRWSVTPVNFEPIAAISPENVNVNWDSSFAGTEIDPTGQTEGESELVVSFAFPVSSGNPLAPAEPSTWYTGAWLMGTNCKGYIAYVTVGPGTSGPTLSAGQTYDVWSQVVGTPDAPKKFVGQLRVY